VGGALLVASGAVMTYVGATYKDCPLFGGACTSNTQWWAILGGIGLAAAGVACGFSAAYGYSHTADCREVKRSQLSCISGVENACQSLKQRMP
jgi:hypothetical protein